MSIRNLKISGRIETEEETLVPALSVFRLARDALRCARPAAGIAGSALDAASPTSRAGSVRWRASHRVVRASGTYLSPHFRRMPTLMS
jgi:hypothetical protein